MTTPNAKTNKQVDLDNLIQEFLQWQTALRDAAHENNCFKMEIRSLTRKLETSQEAERIALEDAGKLKGIIDSLQGVLSKRCDQEEENESLKSQISKMEEKCSSLEKEHKLQISESLKNLEISEQAHRQEILKFKEETLEQSRREITELQKSLQEKADEVRQLQKKLVDTNHANHTEIVKIRLEYDAKLLKLQRSNAKAQGGQTSNANSDIFRKKLQFAKAEAQKEITSLKSKVSELERKLSAQQTPVAKRKRF